MKVIADLHIHGRFSRATSKAITIQNLEKWARTKGIDLLGTGDFTHPDWIKELRQELYEDGSGILRTKTGFPFILQTEVSLIYSQAGKGRRIHNILLAPSFEIVSQITEYLKSKGRVDYDGRPIFNISCVEFVEAMKEISKEIEIIPAHIWTPWFSLFGSMSGFDSLREAFADQTKNIRAVETGMSSDPAMNWRLSQLDDVAIVSFSDSHSFWPWRLGREATIFELKKLDYSQLTTAFVEKERIAETIEVSPLFGKYHLTGHRNCNVSMTGAESKKINDICPVCKRQMTVGVEERVEKLADRPLGFVPEQARPFKTLIPLSELIAAVNNTTPASKTSWKQFNALIERFGSELNVLINAPEEELRKLCEEKLVETILLNRAGKIQIKGGYDGLYGIPIIAGREVKISGDSEEKITKKEKAKKCQTVLDSFS